MSSKSLITRIVILLLVVVAFIGSAMYVLADLQIVNGASYAETANRRLSGNTPIYAARGEIVDRNGEKLVSNTMSFIIRFNKSLWNEENQNTIISGLLDLISEYELSFNSSLPILIKDDVYSYSADTETLEKFVKSKTKEEITDLTADKAMDFLVSRYDLSEYGKTQALSIASVRYEMEQQNFSSLNNFVFVQDVNLEIVTIIKERSEFYIGVEIDTQPVREYKTPYAAHILGRVGPIFKEEYDELKSQGYKMDATIGKDGMEKVLEQYLKATDGRKAADLIVNGEVLAKGVEIDPIPGNNAVLTLDLNLQKVAEESLAKTIESIRQNGIKNNRGGYDVKGGAAVVLDVKTGEVLALASYPTYNLETFSKDYSSLLEDPLKPMFNRAIAGAYPPGSTYKMVTALAALEEGVATVNTRIKDQGIYRFYAPQYEPRCWIYRDRGQTHGTLDVSGAIKHSCNYYFYEVGRLLTASKMEEYAASLGLGNHTGIELSGEARGTIAGPTSRTAKGGTWYPGDTLGAAIGQSDHQYTPIQLANYVATLANGGTLNQVHLLKRIENSDYSEVILENNPEPLNQLDITPVNLRAILQGMSDVVNEGGTAASVFRNYPIAVAGKTGSAQQSTGSAHGVFVSYAPFDNPEIAVCVLAENGGSGGNVAPVVRDIYDEYFGLNKQVEETVISNDISISE